MTFLNSIGHSQDKKVSSTASKCKDRTTPIPSLSPKQQEPAVVLVDSPAKTLLEDAAHLASFTSLLNWKPQASPLQFSRALNGSASRPSPCMTSAMGNSEPAVITDDGQTTSICDDRSDTEDHQPPLKRSKVSRIKKQNRESQTDTPTSSPTPKCSSALELLQDSQFANLIVECVQNISAYFAMKSKMLKQEETQYSYSSQQGSIV
jgi:hypothetical protein